MIIPNRINGGRNGLELPRHYGGTRRELEEDLDRGALALASPTTPNGHPHAPHAAVVGRRARG